MAKFAELFYSLFPSSTSEDIDGAFKEHFYKDSFAQDDVLAQRVVLKSLMDK